MLVYLIPLLLILTVPFAFADERDSGIRHVKCIYQQPSILTFESQQISEFDYNLSLNIEQNDGKCIMKNKLGKMYLTSWMPVYHVVILKDMDFGEIESQRLMIPEQTEIVDFKLQNEIPYCIEVVSVWLDNRVRTEPSSEICFEI